MLPRFESLYWQGLFAPARTPPAAVEPLRREAAAALASPAEGGRFQELCITSVGNSPDEFRAFVASRTKRWGEAARRANIRLE